MKWVRCVYEQSNRLTLGKIYEVLEYNSNTMLYKYNESIIVINDKNEQSLYYMRGWFEDATDLVREIKLNKILEDERYTIEVSE